MLDRVTESRAEEVQTEAIDEGNQDSHDASMNGDHLQGKERKLRVDLGWNEFINISQKRHNSFICVVQGVCMDIKYISCRAALIASLLLTKVGAEGLGIQMDQAEVRMGGFNHCDG